MTIIEAAKAFIARAKDMTRAVLQDELKTLPQEVRDTYYDLEKQACFLPEREKPGSQREHVSPNGKYKLVISSFETRPGCWGYTQGKAFALESDVPIATVQRNYSGFPFSWIEDHVNGHAYLVCGEDYQGQTVIELDTGKRRDFLPEDAEQGHGFCWTGTHFDKETSTLVADGCIWACPYEFRFYDFSEPMSGWPEIESEECIDVDQRIPTFNADGTIVCYQTESESDDEEDQPDDAPPKERDLAASTTFLREGLKLVKQSEWVSDKEKARRSAWEEGQRKYKADMDQFRTTDPLYLAFVEHLKDPAFSPEESSWSGVTHNTWCPDFKIEEPRFGKDIVTAKTSPYKLSLEWARKTGPVKLIINKDGKRIEDKFWMEHSVASMDAAFAHARALLTGVPDAGG